MWSKDPWAYTLAEFMYHVFTCMPSESYRRWFRSLLCSCRIFWPLISFLCWYSGKGFQKRVQKWSVTPSLPLFVDMQGKVSEKVFRSNLGFCQPMFTTFPHAVSMHGCCRALHCLIGFSSVVLYTQLFSQRWWVPTNPKDSPIPLFVAILCSLSWVRKSVE